MNLTLRLNLIITFLLLLIMIIGSVLTIKNARENIQAEIASTATLALHMLDAEISAFSNKEQVVNQTGSIFQLKDLKDIRHLKIDFFDNDGNLQDSNFVNDSNNRKLPPEWFVNAMGTVTEKLTTTRKIVFISGQRIGELVITPDISYEVAEEWQETKNTLLLFIVFFIVVNIVIFIAVSIALRPIDKIVRALTDLEYGNLSTRLPKFTLPEFSNIGEKFNVMAEALQSSIDSNHQLSQQLMRLQEDERKNLAQELHDEIGQHLTAIHMDASAIKSAKNISTAQASAVAIDAVVRRMMEIVRTMLQRLRHSDLDELGLDAALRELVSTWLERNPEIILDLHISGDFIKLDDAVLISVYRLLQECLTNIARHANARRVTISVEKNVDQIKMVIKDDGYGFDHKLKTNGFGLAGMRERVEGLTGKFVLQTGINKGVTVRIELPCAIKEK